MLPCIIRPRHIKPNTKPNIKPTTLGEATIPKSPIPASYPQHKPLLLTPPTPIIPNPKSQNPKIQVMTNQENMRGNPNPNSNTPAPAPSPSASTSNTPSNKPPPTSTPSLASRIQTSATGLAKSAFQPSSDLANTLASTTSSKPAGPSTLPNTQTSRDLPANLTQHGAPGSGSGSAYAAQSFREHDPYTSTTGGFALPALTEDEFQGNGNDIYGYDGIGRSDNTDADHLRANTTTTTASTTADPNTNTIQSQDLQTPSSTWKGKARAHDPTQHQFETVWQRQWHDQTPHTTVPATDGAAVVSLLSDITFDPNFEDPTTIPDTEIDIAAAPAPLSVAEREMLDSFRRGLGLDVEGDNQRERERDARLTGASLIPDIDVFLSQGIGAESGIGSGIGTGEGNAMAMATGSGSGSGFIPTSIRDAVLRDIPGGSEWVGVQETDIDVFLSQGVGAGSGSGIRIGEENAMATGSGSTSTSTSLRDAVLANLPGAGDWIGVQERYHDEVWGFLQPVLEEARAEIEEKGVEGLGPGEDGPAVRRLKMILMHMKG
ncbi:hypothetical protein ACN42_g7659 [Penicillium freii]|uniref:Uncharacterized protein n=1 Tax=Penicillium freii TaxID=48697 RepID=A0A101MF74_PENFR|nr:hypothetical protein ACN42_g7659 [Penicillium freii]